MPCRVLVVGRGRGETSLLLEQLALDPDLVPVGVFSSLPDALASAVAAAHDVLLLGRRQPGSERTTALGLLHLLCLTMDVVVLSTGPHEETLGTGVSARMSKVVCLSRSSEQLTHADRVSAAAEAELVADLLVRASRAAQPSSATALTKRELEILGLMAEGYTNAVIAERLFISVYTVHNHVANLSAKLKAHSKLEAVATAVQLGLLPNR